MNTYFFQFRLALLWFCLLIVLRALVELIQLIFNKFLLFNFPFFNFKQYFPLFSLDKYCCIFNVVTTIKKMLLKFLKWSSATTHLSCFQSMMQSTFTFFPSFLLSRALHIHLACMYKPFINSSQSYLFRYKCWLNYFSAVE